MRAASACGRIGTDLFHVEIDLRAEICAAFAYRVSQILEGELGILRPVARNNVAAAPANQFIDAEVFEMSAVREIHESLFVVGTAGQFRQ